MLQRLKAFFNFENFCRGCELYSEVLAALGLLGQYTFKQDADESATRR